MVRGASAGAGKGKQREELVADPEPRRMKRCTVVDPVTGEDLDDGLAVFFKGKFSVNIVRFLAHVMVFCRPSLFHDRRRA
jgi:hypothetical protein